MLAAANRRQITGMVKRHGPRSSRRYLQQARQDPSSTPRLQALPSHPPPHPSPSTPRPRPTSSVATVRCSSLSPPASSPRCTSVRPMASSSCIIVNVWHYSGQSGMNVLQCAAGHQLLPRRAEGHGGHQLLPRRAEGHGSPAARRPCAAQATLATVAARGREMQA
jgi:hypothetical protein